MFADNKDGYTKGVGIIQRKNHIKKSSSMRRNNATRRTQSKWEGSLEQMINPKETNPTERRSLTEIIPFSDKTITKNTILPDVRNLPRDMTPTGR